MALADWDAFKTAIRNPNLVAQWGRQLAGSFLVSNDTSLGWINSGVLTGTVGIAVPGATAVCDETTAGGLKHPPINGTSILTWYRDFHNINSNSINPPAFLLFDRLVHNGGLSGNINTLQDNTSDPTKFPTTALTRYTSGVGVMIALQIYTALGATDTTVTVKYTNTSDTGGRTGTVVMMDTPSLHSFYLVNLQAGDEGVKSVQSIQLSAATGTVGSIGVTLFKPLALVGSSWSDVRYANRIIGWNSSWGTNACLDVCGLMSTTFGFTNTGFLLGMSDV